MIFLVGIVVFCSAAAIDICEAFYVRAVSDGAPKRAALCSIGMYLLGCVGLFSVLEVSYGLIIPECFGLYVGTIIAITNQNARRRKDAMKVSLH